MASIPDTEMMAQDIKTIDLRHQIYAELRAFTAGSILAFKSTAVGLCPLAAVGLRPPTQEIGSATAWCES